MKHPQTPPALKPGTSRRALALGALVVVGSTGAFAQAVNPTTPAATAAPRQVPAATATSGAVPARDEALVLSPFEVNSARDTGFVAATAVAGGRLAIDLKDAPVAYSVLNKEFLDALQITGLEQAADWAPNTTRVPDHGHENTWGGSVLVSSRGVSSFFAQRDFFQYQMDFDSYNLDRIDYGRGPNAVLFGFASFGGAQSAMSKQARLDSTFGETRLSYGSWEHRRGTLDYNMRLGNNAAIRVNGLLQRSQGWRDAEFLNRKALHIAGKVRLGQRTEIRAEVERGFMDQNTPYHTYLDGILGWDGSTVYDTRRATQFADATARGVTSYGNLANNVNTFIYSPMQNQDSIIDVMGSGRTTGVGSTRIGGMSFLGNNNFNLAPVIEDPFLPANRYALAVANSKFRVPGERDRFGLTNDPLNTRDYRIGSIFITHQIGNFYLEMASNHSFNERLAMQHVYAGTGINEYIDINRTLANGAPNPMFLEPYTEGRLQRRHDDWRGRNHRLSGAYVMDNTRFGSYSFQAMIGSAYSDRYYASDSYQVLRGTETANWAQGSEQVMFRRYLNHPASFDLNLPTAVTYIDNTGTTRTANAGWLPGFNEENRKVKFAQASIRGRWFDNRLIGIVSGRVDDVYRQGRVSANNRDLVGTNWDPYKPAFLPFISQSEWLSLTYIPKDTAGNAIGPALPAVSVPRDSAGFRLPQYRNDRFRADYSNPPLDARTRSSFAGLVYHITPWVSAAVNYSQGADYNDAPQKWDGATFPMRKSEGKDASLRFTLLDGRLNTTVTYYQGEEENEGINTGNLGIARWGSFNTLLSSNRLDDLSENGINARGVPLVPSPGWDSRTRKNEGFEIDAIANLTRNWRLTVNFALPKAVQEDTAPDFRNYFDANQASLRQILADSGILVDSSNFASLDPSIPASRRAPNNEHQNAANAWNAVYQDRQSIVTGAQDLARSMKFIGNIYTDYRFPSGPLQGLRVGGGMNYRGAQVIGYRGNDTIVDPTNSTRAIDDPSVGPYDTVKSDAYYNVTLNFGYRWKFSEKLTFDFDLKVDNLLDDHDPIYIATTLRPRNGDLNSPARVTVPGGQWWRQTPRNYTFSVTTRF
jgi:outer membrane receptor protein involved in Fe transport